MDEPLTTLGGESAGPKRADVSSLDAQLLAQIARERDAGAMSRFVERHQGPAYNLALHMTGSREQAEDVLQEALLVVWQRAGQYRGFGAARGWLLRIVAFKALQFRRANHRSNGRIQEVARTQPQEDSGPERAAHQSLEYREDVAALQAAIGALPDLDQVLLALHYGAELRVTEIARQCRMPRQTVKARLSSILEILRARLKNAGVVAPAVPLSWTLLREALGGTAQPPEGFGQRVVERLLARAEGKAQGATWRWSAWAAGAGATLCVVLGVLALRGADPLPLQSAKLETEPLRAGESGAAAARGPSPSQAVPFDHRFSFATSRYTPFPVSQGVWNWQPAVRGGPGGVVVGPTNALFCFLPVRLPPRPLLLEMRLRAPQEWLRPNLSRIQYACGIFRADLESTPPHRQYKNLSLWLGNPPQDRYLYRAYLLERFTVGFFEPGGLQYLHEYEEPYPGDRGLLELRNWVVDEVRICALREEELPNWSRDPLTLLQGLRVFRSQHPRIPCGPHPAHTGQAVP